MGHDGRDDDRDADRAAILARRSRFIALALGGLTSATMLGCGDEEEEPPPQLELIELRPQPQVCLSLEDPQAIDDRMRRIEAEREDDAGPSPPASATHVPCLSAAVAPEAEVDAGPAADPKPPRMMRRRRRPPPPCLQPGPMACLDFPFEFKGGGDDDA